MPTDFNDPILLAALERLTDYYNSNAYNATTNPGGFANDGHQANFIPSLQDFAALCNALSLAVDTLSRMNLPEVSSDDDGKIIQLAVINGVITANLTGVGAGPGYDVFLFWGQSNMAGRGGPIDPMLDTTDIRIQEWAGTGPSAGTMILAQDPLIGVEGGTDDTISPVMTFARKHVEETGRKTLIVQTAVASTSLVAGDADWGYSIGALYAQAVSLVNAAMAADSDNVFKGIIGAQGENDIATVGFTDYSAAIDAVIDGFRADITGASPSTPFVMIQMPGVESDVNDAQDQMLFRRAYTGFTYTPSNVTGLTVDGIHWTGPQYRINGQNAYEEGYVDALARTSTSNGGTQWGNYDRWQRNPEIVLENSNQRATRPLRTADYGSYVSVRSKRGYGTGKRYVELKLTVVGAANEIHFGIGTIFDFTESAMASGGTYNVGYNSLTGSTPGTSVTGGPGAIGDGETLGIELDLGVAKTIRFNKNGGTWSSLGALPAGFTIDSEPRPVYLWATLPIYSVPGAPSAKVEINAFPVYSVPSGATYWGS